MRRHSARTGFSSTATLIVAALFSVTASAVTLTPLPTTYDHAARTLTIGVSVAGIPDGPGTPTVEIFYLSCGRYCPSGPAQYPGPYNVRVVDGAALFTVPLPRPGPYNIGAQYSGPDGTPSRVSFTIEVPVGGDVIVAAVLGPLLD